MRRPAGSLEDDPGHSWPAETVETFQSFDNSKDLTSMFIYTEGYKSTGATCPQLRIYISFHWTFHLDVVVHVACKFGIVSGQQLRCSLSLTSTNHPNINSDLIASTWLLVSSSFAACTNQMMEQILLFEADIVQIGFDVPMLSSFLVELLRAILLKPPNTFCQHVGQIYFRGNTGWHPLTCFRTCWDGV